MPRKNSKSRRHNLTLKQRRAKEAAKPKPEVYTPEEIEAMRAELGRRLDRLARSIEEGHVPGHGPRRHERVSRYATDPQPTS